MNEWYQEAVRKLDKEIKEVSGRHEEVMKRAVRDALAEFCRQDAEFAQAVVQGGSFADCMKAVAKGVGSSISDLEAYVRAVRFFFPGAGVDVKMTINLTADVDGEDPSTPLRSAQDDKNAESKAGVIIDLSAFF